MTHLYPIYGADAFGNPCKSLKQVIEDLQKIVDCHPHLANEPVWVDFHVPVIKPVTVVGLRQASAGDFRTVISVIQG